MNRAKIELIIIVVLNTIVQVKIVISILELLRVI
jgi:hypothetical protein